MKGKDSTTQLGYVGSYDLAQGTGFQTLTEGDGVDNDQANCGELRLYNPSSTTFVKHYISKFNVCRHNDFTANWFTAGYGNTTSAVNAIQFKFLSGKHRRWRYLPYTELINNNKEKTMPRYHNINGERIQFTAEEEAARDAEEQAWADAAKLEL